MPVSSSANTRLAVTVLSEFAAIWPKSSVDEMIDKVMQLLPEGSDDVAVEPTLFGMLTSISGSKTLLSFTSERLELIVENLQNLIYSHDISTVADAVESLKAVSTFETQPIFFSLASNRFSAGEAPVLLLEATTAIGIELRITAAEAVLKKTGKESVVFSGPLSVSAEGKAALDLGAEKLAPYRYTVEFSVSLEGRPSAILYEDTFTLMGSYEISSVQFGIGANKKTLPSQLVSVDTPFSLPSSLKASAHRSEYVSVAFEVSATNGPLGGKFFKPHQVFVRYTHSLSPAVSAVFLCSWEGKLDDALGGRYRHILSTAEESASFNHLAGEYIVSILVSDFASEAVEWSLGSFTLELSTPAVKIAPLYTKSLLDASDRTLVPLPEIKHKMRPPAKRASLVMSALFTLLSLAPFAAFIFVTLSLKMDLQRLRTVKNLLFLGSITVFLLMYAGYWLGLPGLSFYETISYIVFLTPVTVIIGRAALSNLSQKKD